MITQDQMAIINSEARCRAYELVDYMMRKPLTKLYEEGDDADDDEDEGPLTHADEHQALREIIRGIRATLDKFEMNLVDCEECDDVEGDDENE